MVKDNVIPILSLDAPADRSSDVASPSMRIYQVFVNVEGLAVRVRSSFLGIIPFPQTRRFGFFAVMTLAAPPFSRPPLLLSLARDALAEEFSPISRTSDDEWLVEQLEWRETGAAPPMFRQPGCIDHDWGAAWYELGDEGEKQHRRRLAKTRLWKGHRAKERQRQYSGMQVDGGRVA